MQRWYVRFRTIVCPKRNTNTDNLPSQRASTFTVALGHNPVLPTSSAFGPRSRFAVQWRKKFGACANARGAHQSSYSGYRPLTKKPNTRQNTYSTGMTCRSLLRIKATVNSSIRSLQRRGLPNCEKISQRTILASSSQFRFRSHCGGCRNSGVRGCLVPGVLLGTTCNGSGVQRSGK